MKCKSCGEVLEEGDAFCSECGSECLLKQTCGHCGAQVSDKQDFCKQCGFRPDLKCPCEATLKPQQKFCRRCGLKAFHPVEKRVCPDCKTHLESDARFCEECGFNVEESTSLPTSTLCCEKLQSKQPETGESSPQTKCADPKQPSSDLSDKKVQDADEGTPNRGVVGETIDTPKCHDSEVSSENTEDEESTESSDNENTYDTAEEEEIEPDYNAVEVDKLVKSSPKTGCVKQQTCVPDRTLLDEAHSARFQESGVTPTTTLDLPAEAPRALPEQAELTSSFENTPAELAISKTASVSSLEHPVPDTTPSQSSSLDEFGTDIEDQEEAAKEAERSRTAYPDNIASVADTAAAADGTDDTQPDDAKTSDTDSGKEEGQMEEKEEELSRHSSESGCQSIPAEQSRGTGSHRNKPGGKQRKKKVSQKREHQQHSAFALETADETKVSPEKSEYGSSTTVFETTRSKKTDLDINELASAEQPADSAPETSPDTTPAQSSSPCESGTHVKDTEPAAKGTETEGKGDSVDIGGTKIAPPAEGNDDSKPAVARSESGSGEEKEEETEESEGELSGDSSGHHHTPAEQSAGKGSHMKKPSDNRRKNKEGSKKREDQQHSASTMGTADETEASPEQFELGSPTTVCEAMQSEKTDIDMKESTSAEQPASPAPELSSDTRPAESSSPCGLAIPSEDPELGAEDTGTERTGDSVDILGTKIAPPAEGNDDSKPAVARSESGSGEEKEEETEEGEEELSGDSSGHHHTPAEQSAGKGSHMKKPSDNKRKNKKGLKRKDHQQHFSSEKQSASVVFHVVISNRFKHVAANNHHVFVCLDPESQLPQMHELQSIGQSGECGHLYRGQLNVGDLPKDLKFTYAYCVEKDGKYEWEHVYFHKGTKVKSKVWRKQELQMFEVEQRGTWDVYDCIAYPDGMKGMLDSLRKHTGIGTSSTDIFVSDMMAACQLFLPKPDTVLSALCSHVANFGPTAQHFLKEIRVIGESIPFSAVSLPPERGFSKCLEQYLTLLENLATLSSERTVVLAVFLLLLAEEYGLDLSPANKSFIFRGLLIRPDMEKKTCPDIEYLYNHFPLLMKDRHAIARKIRSLFKDRNMDTDPSWVYSIPLHHLLCEDSKEFQEPTPSHHHKTEEWWGTHRILQKVDAFKRATDGPRDWTIPANDVFKYLSDAFRAVPLMLRTFAATMNCRQLVDIFSCQNFPAEIVMAAFIYQLCPLPNIDPTLDLVFGDILRKTAASIKTSEDFTRNSTSHEVELLRCMAMIGINLLSEVTKPRKNYLFSLVPAAVNLQLSVLSKFLQKDQRSSRAKSKQTEEIISTTNNIVSWWIHSLHCDCYKWEDFIQIMEECIQSSAEIPDQALSDQLKDYFSAKVKQHVGMISHPVDRLAACLQIMEGQGSLSGAVAEDIHKHMEFAFVAKQLENFKASVHNMSQTCVLQSYMSDLFNSKWEKQTSTSVGQLEFIFTWKPLVVYLSLLRDREQGGQNCLARDVARKVQKTIQDITYLVECLMSGNIEVYKVQWLLCHQHQFLEVTQVVLNNRGRADCALQLRAKELDMYEDTVKKMKCVLDYCKSIIKTDDASDAYQRFVDSSMNIHNQFITSICVRPPKPGDIDIEQYKPRVQIETVPGQFQVFLPCLAQRHDSAVFRYMLETLSKSVKISAEDKWWDVLVSVWQQTEGEWQQICEAMRTGEITFPETEKLFSIFENSSDRFEKCKRELRKMIGNDGDGHLVNVRIQQFQCLSSINSKKNAARILCQLKEDFGFCGDLENIQTFQDVDMTQPIGHVALSVVNTSTALQDIDSIDVEHFRQFGSEKCTKFVHWVRETMAIEGLKEVKVFVDLALNHVGDNPHDMDKVRNLRTVITGYAPLIFQMTAETTFLERCHEVACNIKADPDLPAKLQSTVTLLEWFDKIHKFHGSVEKTALAQVESITSRGILKIGRLKRNWKRGIDLEFSDVICLELPKDPEGQSDARTYSYQDLVDLQSRLMLVVGHDDQGKTNVDRFISVMDSVERLVKTYIQLCRDGCLLFLNWTVKLYFDQTRGVCCIVEFFRGEGTKKQLKGKQGPHTLEDYMAKVAHYLDSSRDSWLNYVAMKREEYEELNMYTMDQLVFLQEQLILLENKDISPQVFPLLSLLQPQCTIQDVRNAVEQAAQQDDTPDGAGEDEEEKEEKEKVRLTALFIQHMQENSFSKQLAIKALKNDIDPSNLDEGVTWCFEHFEDEGDDEEESINEEDVRFTSATALRLQTREGTIASALEMLEKLWSGNQLPLDTLAESLTETWNQFLSSVKDSGDDFLSLHHLGIVLKFLKKQDNCEHKRQLPPLLKAGEPNLIVCPKGEVLYSVTSIYMHTKEAPLPQPDEVLLCTLETTLEEVRIFLQRAFSVSSFEMGKIHCLAFADSLDYDVSEGVERDMKKLIKISDHPYHLVVICTSENEFSARITAALERYLRPPCTLINNTKLLEYLSAKFTIPDDAEPQHFAASVDPERMCVRVVKSSQSGMGKTLYKNRVVAKLKSLLHGNTGPGDDSCVDMEDKEPDAGDAGGSDDESVSDGSVENKKHAVHVTVPLYEKWVDTHHVAMTLLRRLPPSTDVSPRLIHLDIAYEVQEGVDLLLYNLLVLGCITDVHGQVWRRSSSDLYLVEAMPLLEHTESEEKNLLHQIFAILPSVKCWSPCESLSFLGSKEKQTEKEIIDQLFDNEEYKSTVFQRPIHYLSVLPRGHIPPFDPKHLTTRNKHGCLEILIRHCGVKNPSWSELYHFVSFLNKQLEDFEHSIFCSSELSQDLPDFPAFVLKFLIHMSRDFATRSINMAEESLPVLSQKDEQGTGDTTGIQQFQMRRTWESSPHPYIFFNPDQTSMTFLGFKVHPLTFNLITETGDVLERKIMGCNLYQSLLDNGVPLFEDFDKLPRDERLLRLYQVMGVPDDEMKTETGKVIDPDSTYELTTDNVKKIMAIYMRFRCNIPVIIMGETGCGKTRLVKFLCALQTPKLDVATTMIIMKVHGGTKADDIQRKVQDAETLAKVTKKNVQQGGTGGRPIYTVLFFDEANTTEAIGAIKEVMCDGAMNGRPIQLHQNLKMVAACNPYRKHSQKVIQRLEKAGLGYHISAQKTCDKLGRIPMRQLVYRVQPLPQSMLPLVWDFGQLDTDTERMYIRQMVLRYLREEKLGNITEDQAETMCNILVISQKFLGDLKDECHFVSLRDADRVLTVISWFLQQPELLHLIGRNTDTDKADITVAVVLALGVCYRAGIRSKEEFEEKIVPAFSPHFDLSDPQEFRDILNSCQDELLKNVKVGEKIARNQALKENVFMMVVCVELRIPLFVVGKPGSSKSLAKAIVTDTMQGAQSINPVFKTFKEAQMVSFQCSPLATADGILGTFRQCAHIQHDKDKDKFVAVAVLDEIGLAEDSPKMPLKALHPLLEDGCELEQDEEVEDTEDEEEITDAEGDQSIADSGDDFKMEEDAPKKSRQTRLEKVAFIGISNWALDPAKMNRGILVQRDVPDEEELVQTAEGICGSGDPNVLGHVKSLVNKLARAYLSVFQEAVERREFFGLRDFYSLVKMVHAIATSKQRKLTQSEFRIAICRNFGGLDNVDPLKVFNQMLTLDDLHEGPAEYIDSSYSSLLHIALTEDVGESRYLLLLTENYSGLHILTDNLLAKQPVVPIFGSSFPKDQEYTQICCNINRIKVCMETGKTVILLNLDNLYESLYDALNQYYSKLAGARYVDLGLGTHRVKCKVDTKFRLIVVAEKQTVYDKFPIPLINRLEKHFLTVNNLLNEDQHKLAEELTAWVKKTANAGVGNVKLADGEVFIGYHSDIAASTILMSWESLLTEGQDLTAELKEEIMCRSKATLLWCATPDAVLRLQDEWCTDVYFRQQQHDSLTQYLQARLKTSDNGHCLMAQVTTHSKLLTDRERSELERQHPGFSFTLLSLHAFHTQQQFRHKLNCFLRSNEHDDKQQHVLLVQCERGNINQNLLQCAEYCVQTLWSDVTNHHVVFIVQLPRVATKVFSGFMGGLWHCAHVDDLRSPALAVPSLSQLQTSTPAQLLASVAPDNDRQPQTVEDLETTQQSFTVDLVRHLMTSCIQAAVARVRDDAFVNGRSAERIAVLLSCLEQGRDDRFFFGILKMVVSMLQEKETRQSDAKNWLAQDAATPEMVKKAGTMRRAWMLCLEHHMVPILAGVIAYLDTNHNLDMLNEGGWASELWLRVLHDPSLCRLQYSDLLSMSGHQTELREFACRCTFAGEDMRDSSLPFSWVIVEMIEAFLVKPPAQEDNEECTEETACEAFEKSTISHHLQDVISPDLAPEFLQRYLSDLLHVTFRLNVQQHKLLMQCMNSALGQEGVEVQAHRLSQVLVRVHRLMVAVRPRLQAVLDMAACHPQAIQALQDKRHDPQVFDQDNELIEDILLLEILAKELTPQPNQMNTEDGCLAWLDLYSKVAPLISRVMQDADCNSTAAASGRRRETEDTAQQNWLTYGPWCQKHLTEIRCLWTRVSTVKLFIDYMSPLLRDTGRVQVDPKRVNYNLLWTRLGKDANLKTKKTLELLDKYLKHANTQMVKNLLGDVGVCKHCNTKLEGTPVQLPCKHRICDKCYTQEARVNSQCPDCRKQIPQDFDTEQFCCFDKAAVDQLECYQRQTSAFLMAVVSQLCFAGQEPPEPDAVEHIFSYVVQHVEGVATVRTQQLTLRDDQLDPSPVLRSFILRLLLKHSESQVSDHISQFLSVIKEAIRQQVPADQKHSVPVLTELSLLIIHCSENLECEKEASFKDESVAFSLESECTRIKQLLSTVRLVLESCPLELHTLTALGKLRFAIAAFARILHANFIEPENATPLTKPLKDLAMEVLLICTMGSETDWPKKFFVKMLCRDFGVQSYMTLLQRAEAERCLNWIKLNSVDQVEEVADRYLMCGRQYPIVRDEIKHEIREHRGELLMRLSEMKCSSEMREYIVLLALHREITMAFVKASPATQKEVKETAQTLVQSRKMPLQNKEFAARVVDNTLGVPDSPLCVGPHHSLDDQSLVCVLTHFWMALRAGQHEQDILSPFTFLLSQPARMMDSFLPTMPQDNVEEIVHAMRIGQAAEPDLYAAFGFAPYDNTALWECPRGHRYTIGECGQPNAVATCPECGVQIGAVDTHHMHVPAEGNRRVDRITDRTQPGHTLGAVEDRSREAVPERGMSAAACTLVRFLTHAALFISASQPGQAAVVSQMIRPAVREEDVIQFFWGHLHKDLQVLQHVLGKCCDDIYLLLHHLCHQLAELPPAQWEHRQLKSKTKREQWERRFTETYVQPVIQHMDRTISEGNDTLVSDARQGQNQLLNIVFEVEEQDSDESIPLQHTAAPWKYHTHITVDHFFRQFQLSTQSSQTQSSQLDLPVLKLFFDEGHHLRALHYVSDIMALQHRVLQQLRHRLSRLDAKDITIQKLMDKIDCPDLPRLLEIFSKAWDMIKEFLVSYRCRTIEGRMIQLPEEYHTVSVSENSPVGMLLPDTEGPGRCTYLLIHYLLVQHNNFLAMYCPHTRQKYAQLPEVRLHEITRRHLVSYSPQVDLLPLVLAHCNYSLHLGHGDSATATRLEYDFQGFELQLKNTLLLSKSRVHRNENGSMEIETMTYCADTTNSRLINKLRDKIDQIQISLRVQRQIAFEFGDSLPDICQSIDSINTTLPYLITLKVAPDQRLHTFMTETLRMRDTEGLHSRKAQQHCRVGHVQSLWLMLCFLRARLLATHKQEAFDGQGEKVREELSAEQKEELEAAFRRLSPERVELVLAQIFQCIVLQLIPQSKDEDFASPRNYNLSFLVRDSLENPLYSNSPEDSPQDQLTEDELQNFPESILASQAIPAWLHLVTHYVGKSAPA